MAVLDIGESALLTEFFAQACRMPDAEVIIVAPFVDARAFDRLGSSWNELAAGSRVAALVRTRESATALFRAAPSRARLEVRIDAHLHAKVFVAWRPTGRVVALIGSHNLTGAAIEDNLEAGILVAGAQPDERRLVGRIRELAARAFSRGAVLVGPDSATTGFNAATAASGERVSPDSLAMPHPRTTGATCAVGGFKERKQR